MPPREPIKEIPPTVAQELGRMAEAIDNLKEDRKEDRGEFMQVFTDIRRELQNQTTLLAGMTQQFAAHQLADTKFHDDVETRTRENRIDIDSLKATKNKFIGMKEVISAFGGGGVVAGITALFHR